MQDILSYVKTALRITTDAFDEEIETLIESARQDLGIAGVVLPYGCDAITRQAITTYCKVYFGSPDEFERLKRSYDEQKAQLQMSTGYTIWKAN